MTWLREKLRMFGKLTFKSSANVAPPRVLDEKEREEINTRIHDQIQRLHVLEWQMDVQSRRHQPKPKPNGEST